MGPSASRPTRYYDQSIGWMIQPSDDRDDTDDTEATEDTNDTEDQARQTRPNSGGGLQKAIQDSTKGGLQYFFTFYALKIELFRVFTLSD